jgi:hypothetical protein
MTRSYVVIYFICVLFSACGNKESERNMYFDLERVGSISFPLDSLTSYFNHFQVVNEGDRRLLYMLTQFYNRYVIFDIETQEMVKSFKFENDTRSPITIGAISSSGFSFISSDSIFLYDFNRQNIFLGNEKGDKKFIVSMRKQFLFERECWGTAFQSAAPIMINDSFLSVTGAVVAGKTPLKLNQTSDFNLNFNTKEVCRTMNFPSAYFTNNYYPTNRLRPTRALDEERSLVYYNYLNSDSIQILNYKTGNLTSFYANNIGKLPTIETSDFDEFRTFEDGFDNQRIYNSSQGTFITIYYNSFKDEIIRVGSRGIQDFSIQNHDVEFYKYDKIISFYDAVSHRFLGNITMREIASDIVFCNYSGSIYLTTVQFI